MREQGRENTQWLHSTGQHPSQCRWLWTRRRQYSLASSGVTTVYYFKYFIVEENHETVSLFGLSFVLSGLYLAVGQAANIIGVMLAAPVSNRIGKKKTYMWSMICATLLRIVFSWLARPSTPPIFTFPGPFRNWWGRHFHFSWRL